ncbi:hypothetical protein FN846DRAFT_969025 [Sphaerosporella brunnea]|uniref:Fungal N-terminal domain-containing protein n=1 Tax=Sphaerosporella brunnea TaxID=1250544 RepID=A0A5J5EK19_9PEZI|nr:hypothetical protein FN846DRAFT_969025 [Sphaerosporella brunnea]
MSFGFSIGDIIALTQLSYQIYGILSSERQSAPTVLRELSTSVFGLRCALDHLSQHLSSSAAKLSGENGKLQHSLAFLIRNCGETLRELQAVLAKYEDKVVVKAVGTTGKLKREWNRVKWAVEEKGLVDIKSRISQHTDAIGIVVETFIWTEVQDGREEARQGMRHMETLLERILEDGEVGREASLHEMERLLKDFMLTEVPKMVENIRLSTPRPPAYAMLGTPNGDSTVLTSPIPSTHIPTASGTIKFGMRGMGSATTSGHLEDLNRRRTAAAAAGAPGRTTSDRLEELNRRRTAARKVPPLPQHPLEGGRGPPGDLAAFPSPGQWLSKLEQVIDRWSGPAGTTKDVIKTGTLLAVNLLSELNGYISGLNSKEERRRYRSGLEAHGRLQKLFGKVTRLSKGSVLLRKQVEEYEDEKEEDEA